MGAVKKFFASLIVVAFTVIGSMLGGPIGAAIGSMIGTALVNATLLKPKKGATQEQAKSVVRLPESTRWLAAGRTRVGGAVVFAEFDSAGNLWYVIVHGDMRLSNIVQRYFDDVPITVDGAGNVTTDDFCLDTKKNIFKPGKTKVPYFQIWTTTYTASNPTPPGIAALMSALPTKWTSDHKLVGTTYSVVKCKAVEEKSRYNVYKWRGVLGLGEPGFTLVGDWSFAYDPRDEGQDVNDASTHSFTRNVLLIWAWFRTHPFGRNKSVDSIDWVRVGEQADICDGMITGIAGEHVRYQCGIAIPENRGRDQAEQDIIACCDGQIVFNDEGKAWVRAGYYYAPTLALNRNRDIVAMESIEATDGESETQGVIVRYTDPTADYTLQPSAPWYNPNYYVEGQGVTFLTVEIEGITDHNQAMRIAKAIGMRGQPLQKIAPMTGLRGLKARQERIVNINYDNTFSGDYEIYSPVEVDESGQFVGFAGVPVDENRWILLPGEEKPKPVVDGEGGLISPTVPAPGSLIADFINGRFEARFNADTRPDVLYEFQVVESGGEMIDDAWRDTTTTANENFAFSDPLLINTDYYYRFRGRLPSGHVSDWTAPIALGTPPGLTSDQIGILNSWIVEVSAGTAVVNIASDGTLTISNNTRRYPDGFPDVSVDGDVIATGLAPGSIRSIAYDDLTRAGGAVTYNLYVDDNDAHVSSANPGRHYMGYFTVPDTGSSGGGGGGVGGGRWENELL